MSLPHASRRLSVPKSPGKVDVVVLSAEFYKPISPTRRKMSHTERRRRWPALAALLIDCSACCAKHSFV